MNLLLLLAALLPWAASPLAAFTRVFLAISLLSLEMQIVTVAGVGNLYALPLVNVIAGAVLIAWQTRRGLSAAWTRSLVRAAPAGAIAAVAALVLVLNAWLPLAAADPYHLDRLTLIERSGTLHYDPAAEPKVNILGWVYELVLADLHQVPGIGAAFLKLHGLVGLLLYALTMAAVWTLLPLNGIRWPAAAMLVVPPVFHQLVLIKNDLFIAAPALVALAWLVTRVSTATWGSALWAGWLTGFVVGYKLTNLPLAVVAAVVVLAAGPRPVWRPFGGLMLGGLIGVVASGLLLTLWQNAVWYGDIFATGPVTDIGNRTTSVAESMSSLARFGVSLVDLGTITPAVWPGRGGWGGTFGLPFVWSALVLLLWWGRAREARWAVTIAALHFALFAAVFPDADLAHRLVLAPALLMLAVAVHLASRPGAMAASARLALVPVLVLSAAQILRSAALYVARA